MDKQARSDVTSVAAALNANHSACVRNSYPLWHAAIFTAILLSAAAVYCFHLGREPLGASEAYSAAAALQPNAAAVAANALTMDPGKPVLYHLALHWFAGWFGPGEASLRAMSVMFGLAADVLVYALGLELFGPEVALAAMALWAFSPLAVFFARWARMYSMFIALTLGHLLAMARLRRRHTARCAVTAGVLGAAMLYTHLGAILILAAEGATMLRDWRIKGRTDTWPALVIAGVLFVPFLPLALAQSNALLFDHWLDWIGTRRHGPIGWKLVAGAMIAASAAWLVLAKPSRRPQMEGLRWCAMVALLPIMAFVGGSVLVRPMFQIRYVGPSLALLTLMLAAAIDALGPRLRNLGVVFAAGLSIALVPASLICRHEPWRELAGQVQRAALGMEPVVFESGFFADGVNLSLESNNGFPQGFFRVPFDYYFRAANPRLAVPAADPAQARKTIAKLLDRSGGVWLISGKPLPDALRELPDEPGSSRIFTSRYDRVLLLHVKRSQG